MNGRSEFVLRLYSGIIEKSLSNIKEESLSNIKEKSLIAEGFFFYSTMVGAAIFMNTGKWSE